MKKAQCNPAFSLARGARSAQGCAHPSGSTIRVIAFPMQPMSGPRKSAGELGPCELRASDTASGGPVTRGALRLEAEGFGGWASGHGHPTAVALQHRTPTRRSPFPMEARFFLSSVPILPPKSVSRTKWRTSSFSRITMLPSAKWEAAQDAMGRPRLPAHPDFHSGDRIPPEVWEVGTEKGVPWGSPRVTTSL